MQIRNRVSKIACAMGVSILLASATAAAAWSNALTISNIQIWPSASGTSTFLSFTTNPNNKPVCATSGSYGLVGTPDQVKAMTTVANAAFLSGKTVSLLWDTTTPCDGTDGRVTVIRMQ